MKIEEGKYSTYVTALNTTDKKGEPQLLTDENGVPYTINFEILQGEKGDPGKDGKDGKDGLLGPQGTPGQWIFDFHVDEKGDLIVTYDDAVADASNFRLDQTTGHLLYELEGSKDQVINLGKVKGDNGNPSGNILQATGQSTEDTMSQKAITDELNTKTNVFIGEQQHKRIDFTSDPQSQIDKKLDKTQCTLDFNQLFNTNTSTLPSGSGLTITNIFGGHHIEGTTDSQYYHTMYNIDTINGHKYYFAANFSDIKDVYIVGKIDSSSFNTKGEKLFTGGDNFIITLQIERDKTINTDLKPILVDLTRMFGEEKEPQTEQEVQEYLVKGTYYPYDDKPSKAEVNSLSMLPSTNREVVFIAQDISTLPRTVTASANGYFTLYGGGVNGTGGINISCDKLYGFGTTFAFVGGELRGTFPVKKGESYTLTKIGNITSPNISLSLIYSVEV